MRFEKLVDGKVKLGFRCDLGTEGEVWARDGHEGSSVLGEAAGQGSGGGHRGRGATAERGWRGPERRGLEGGARGELKVSAFSDMEASGDLHGQSSRMGLGSIKGLEGVQE